MGFVCGVFWWWLAPAAVCCVVLLALVFATLCFGGWCLLCLAFAPFVDLFASVLIDGFTLGLDALLFYWCL